MCWTVPRSGPGAPPLERSADAAGTLGSIVAALCCAGVPIVVGALTAVGLGFLITDLLLLPLLVAMLGLALWGFGRGRSVHGSGGPLALGAVGAVSLTAGVFTNQWLLWLGAVVLVVATIWNIAARWRSVARAD